MRSANKKNRTERRRFLFAAFSLLALAAFGRVRRPTATGKLHIRPNNMGAERLIADLFRDRRAARAVGRRYLMTEPAETNPATLLAALLSTDSSIANQDLRAVIRRLRDRDFRDGNVVFVDGWVLARTEARLCVLAALT